MSGLSPEARLLVAQGRGQGNPSREDRARLRAKLAPEWAAYERERQAHGAQSSRRWWSASATRWLLCVSLAWLGQPTPRVERADEARSVDSTRARVALPVAPPSAAVVAAAAPPSAAASPRATAAELQADARRARAARTLPARASNMEPRPLLARTSSERTTPRAGAAREVGRAPGDGSPRAPLVSGAGDEARAALSRGAGDEARAALAPGAGDEVRAARPQLRAAALAAASPELVRAGPALPEQAGQQFVPQPIGDELELLGVAQDALRKHQPSVALRLVQEHAFRFPRGALSRERQAVQVLALCALQRFGPARSVFEDLSDNANESPMLESVRRACGF